MRSPRHPLRSIVRAAALAIVCASLMWTLWLLALGGFDTTVVGFRIRSNNPGRVLLITLVALAGFFAAGGTVPFRRIVSALRRFGIATAQHPGGIACLIALSSTVVSMAASTRIAGASDSYGYVSQAELWLRGNLKVEQSWVEDVPWPDAMWTFTPLGYRPIERKGDWSIVPTYSPGLPILLAAAKLAGGQCAMFAVVPLLTGLSVLATYGLGLRLKSPTAGLIGAWLLATSPVILGSLEPQTDVPVMAAWTIAWYFLLGVSARAAATAGLFSALAILIRPNLFPLAAPMGAWLLIRRREQDQVLSRTSAAVTFAVGVLLGIGAVAAINHHLYGSATTSGYGRLEDQFAWIRVVPNLRRYIGWLVDTQTPVGLVGLGVWFVPWRGLWRDMHDRTILLTISAFIALLWGMYSAYLEFDSWGYLRFLLPVWPFMTLGIGAAAVAIATRRGTVVRWVTGAAVIGLGLSTLGIAMRLTVFDQRQAARHEAPIGHLVRMHTPENSVILAFERSGSMRYYAGRITLRYDILNGEWLDRAVAWLGERGVRVYAVLDARQAAESKQRFARQKAAVAFDRPILTYQPAGTSLFNLTEPPDPDTVPVVIPDAFPDAPGCDPPVPLSPLVLR